MSRRRAGLSPSLFPFLAVLVCTLGTLILLLALVAQEAKEAAVATAEQKKRQSQPDASAPLEPIALAADSTESTSDDGPKLTSELAERLIDEEQFRLTQLVSFRDEQTQDAEEKRNEVAYLEAAIRDQKEKLEALRDEIEAATGDEKEGDQKLSDALRIDDTTLVMMKEEANKLRAEVEELKNTERGEKPRVVIVPHRGPNGTQRRPLYVECTRDGIQILPEGVRITPSQALAAAEGRNPNGNPLGAALRVARRHAMINYGDPVAPYPLLVLRPGGIPAYRLATVLMKDWDDQYGYELVPGDVDLEFPGGDRVLRKDMEYAVHEASSRNFAVTRRAFGRNYSGAGGGDSNGDYSGSSDSQSGQGSYAGGGNGASSNGGAYPESNPPAKKLPVLSAKSLDQQARSNGFSAAKDQRFSNAFGGYQPPPGSTGESYGSAGALSEEKYKEFIRGGKGNSDDANDMFGTANNSTGGSSGSQGSETQGSEGSSQGSNDGSESNTEGSEGSAASPGGQAQSPSAQATASSQTAGSPPPGSESSSSEDCESCENPGSPSSSPSNPQSQSAQDLVRREGRDWAMPDAFRGMGGTEVVRPISMIVRHDRYELLDRGRVVASFPFARQGVHQSTLQLATAVRDRVSQWGATLPGGRWQPRLEVQVGPHAEQRFHEMETLMQGSGVEIQRRSP